METPAAGKGKRGSANGAASLLHFGLGFFETITVENHQSASGGGGGDFVRKEESTVQPFVGEGGVFRAVVSECPAEGLFKERFREG